MQCRAIELIERPCFGTAERVGGLAQVDWCCRSALWGRGGERRGEDLMSSVDLNMNI